MKLHQVALAAVILLSGAASADEFDLPPACKWREWPARLPGTANATVLYCASPKSGMMQRAPYADTTQPGTIASARAGDADAIAALGRVYGSVDAERGSRLLSKAYEMGSGLAAYDRGERAWLNRDYVQSAEYYRISAERGFSDGMYSLGQAYNNAWGVTQDNAQAARWYRAAAEKGQVEAMTKLGELCTDDGCPKLDMAEGLLWLNKAAEADNTDAMYKLANIYSEGKGVRADVAASEDWRKRAELATGKERARVLNTYAPDDPHGAYFENEIADAYLRGVFGLPQNAKEAVRWYEIAAGHGSSEAASKLVDLYEAGDRVPKDAAEAARWSNQIPRLMVGELVESAENGNTAAMRQLATMNFTGKDPNGLLPVTKDTAQGVIWLTRASEAGDPTAANELAERYANGDGVPKNADEAKRWSGIAAMQVPLLYAAVDTLLADMDKRDGYSMLVIAQRLLNEKRVDDAAFWWVEGQLRRAAEIETHPGVGDGGYPMSELALALTIYGTHSRADMAAIIDRAIAWDKSHPDPNSSESAREKQRETFKARGELLRIEKTQ